MAIIDPDGLFHGDRLRRCSDTARLAWPHLFLLANGCGRFEINHARIAAVVFADFKNPPSEQELYGWVIEYRDAHLLFLYEARGQLWGQWDCKPGCLPRWKTSRDRDSPEPPREAFDNWVRSYREQSRPLQKTSEIFESLRKSSVKLPSGIGIGVGVGDGIGSGTVRKLPAEEKETPSAPNGSAAFALTPPNVSPNGWRGKTFEQFWAVVWWKTGKDAARSSWDRKIKTHEMAELVIAAAREQGPLLLAAAEREQRSVIHPATWLNKGRWSDEAAPVVNVQPVRSARELSTINAAKRFLENR